MKIFKRFFLVIGVLLVLAIGALAAAPFLFKDKILALVKTKANEELNATLSFDDVSLSFFKSFPDLTVTLNDVNVKNHAPFDSIYLFKGEKVSATINLKSLMGDNQAYQVKKILLDKPNVYVKMLEDGKGNWEITKDDGTENETDTSDFNLKLSDIEIKNGHLIYDDIKHTVYTVIEDLNFEGHGDISSSSYDFDTKTNAAALTVEYGNVTYIKKAVTDIDLLLNIDPVNSKYTLKENAVKMNNLTLNAKGWVAMPADDIDMDLSFDSPSTGFGDFLSMIPNAYSKDFEKVKTNGKLKFDGFAKGKYNDTNFPAFGVNMNIADGSFKYPDLPTAVEAINSNIKISCPQTTNIDDVIVDIQDIRWSMKNDPFSGKLLLKNMTTDLFMDGQAKGVINLDSWAKAFPLEGVKALSGIINTDVNIASRMSSIDKKAYDQVKMSGYANVNNLVYEAVDQPKVLVKTMDSKFSPQFVQIDNLSAQLGKSDIAGNGRVDNLLAYFSPKQTLKGKLSLTSNLFDANEWMTDESTSTATKSTSTAAPVANTGSQEATFDRYTFDIDAKFNKILYEDYTLLNNSLSGNVSPKHAEISNFSTQLGSSDFNAKGNITQLDQYMSSRGKLKGDIIFNSSYLDLDELMGLTETTPSSTAAASTTTSTAGSTTSEPFIVPNDLDIVINSAIKKVKYDDMNLENVTGKVIIANGIATLENVNTNAFGGQMGITGKYDSNNPQKPLFDLDYAMKSVDFRKLFDQFNTFKTIAPIGEYIDGKLNTNFKMNGVLGKDMMPDLNSINADGIFGIINAVVKEFKPLNGVSSQMNILSLNQMTVKDLQNAFTIKDGTFTLKQPFKFSHSDIGAELTGSHKLTNDINYLLKLKVPRAKFGSVANQAMNTGIGLLNQQASKLGTSIEQSEFINVNVTFNGNVTSPKYNIQLVNGEGKSTKEAITEKVTDEVKKKLGLETPKVEDKKAEITNTAKEKAEEVKAKVTEEVKQKTEQVKEKATEAVKEKVNEKAGDLLKDKLKDVKLPTFKKPQ